MAPQPLAATVTTIGHTNTLSLTTGTAYQLVSQSAAWCYFGVINLGPGNLYVRFDAAPTGATDTAALELPMSSNIIQFYVYGSLYVLADQTGKISVLVSSR